MTAKRRIILGSALAAPFIRTAKANPVTLRVSLDTPPNHGRTQSVADFLKKLAAASQNRIDPQLIHSGQMFPDRHAIKALIQSRIDMAVPGTWLVAAYVPEADMAQLPVFYGQPIEVTRRAIDGAPGDLVNEQIEKKIRVRILGRWMDLGHINWYSARKPLNTLADLKQLRVRNAGGYALPWRAQYFGAVPNTTPWPDVPVALSQGIFDALQSTDASCASTRLWSFGLRYALIDHQSMANYIPMLSESFWSALTPEMRTLLIDLWSANIGTYRSNLATAQQQAAGDLTAHGVRLTLVSKRELTEQRHRMLAEQDAIARQMKLSPEFLTRINDAVSIID